MRAIKPKQIPTVPFFLRYPFVDPLLSHNVLARKLFAVLKSGSLLADVVMYRWRQMTAGQRVLPDFLIVGEPKCGTTSLFHYISQSPSIIPPMAKETHYFDTVFHLNNPFFIPNYNNPRLLNRYNKQYAAFFPRKKELNRAGPGHRLLTGEATPALLRLGGTHRLVQAIVPAHTKFIALFRNPVTRSRSLYYYINIGKKNLRPFDEVVAETNIAEERRTYESIKHLYSRLAVRAQKIFDQNGMGEEPRILYLPNYSDSLLQWYRTFTDRSRLLILSFEEMTKDPQKTIDTVADFLEIPRYNLLDQNNILPTRDYDSSRNPPMTRESMEKLSELFRPYNQQFYEIAGKDFGWDKPSV